MFIESHEGPTLPPDGHRSREGGGPDDPVPLPQGSPAVRGDAALVLAAGKGTRMRSSLPKVLHRLAGKPMVARVLDALTEAGFGKPTVLVGYGAETIEREVGDRCVYVVQPEQLGTGDAARVGLEAMAPAPKRLLLVHGDEPLIEASVYREMLDLQRSTAAVAVLLTTLVDDTRGFGRVVRDREGHPAALLQESDLSVEQRSLNEVNLGAYVFDVDFLKRQLGRLQPHPPKGEFYLTDLVAMAVEAGECVIAHSIPGGVDVMGINDLVQLEQASRSVYRRTNHRLMESGVTIVDSASTFIDEEVHIEPDTVIHPFTIISGRTIIGRNCQIGPYSRIGTSHIGDACHILSSTVTDTVVEDGVFIGPYAHLRAGAQIGAGAEIGSYAEIKKSSVGPGSKMHHFSYLGDATVGKNVNIGAGTITCNFDGVNKHQTVIEDGAFIGSDTLLRAPVTVGKAAYTGAGSVVVRDVSPGTVVAGVPARPLEKKSRDESEQLQPSDGGEQSR